MALKTPISLLQELMVSKGLPVPIYQDQTCGALFQCTVSAGGISAIGKGSSKKLAKQESAQKAIEKLQSNNSCTQPNPVSFSGSDSFRNFVGELNEFASKNGLSYPVYVCLTMDKNGFTYKCCFLDKETMGFGRNKKEAKQVAAKEMAKLADGVNDLNAFKLEQCDRKISFEDTENVVALYKKLMIEDLSTTNYRPITKTNTFCPSILPDNIITEDLQDLKNRLYKMGIEYSLQQIQLRPCLMCLTIKNTELTFIEADVQKEEATKKVLRKVLEAKSMNCPLNNELFSFQ